MIYEMLKMASADGLSWLEFAGVVFLALYIIWILLGVGGWVCQWCYGFIQDQEDSIPNILGLCINKITGGRGVLPNGWYRSSDIHLPTYWKYRKIVAGVDVSQKDSLGYSTLLEPPKGYTRKMLSPTVILLFFPMLLGSLLLFIDTFPSQAVFIGVMWAVLLFARSGVRIGKKLHKHIENKDIHKQEEA